MTNSPLTKEQLLAALQFHFSYSRFRLHQEEAIQATLAGKDSLLILPTGGGKSMTFQLPALAKGNCFTVVVGPLMALAKDQVDSCLELGIDARIFNSETSDEARRQIMNELVSNEPEMRLLYTTPESLRNPTLRGYLKEAYEAGTLLSFAIDEAHCVSEWGNDFRPAYLELSSLKDDFPNTPIAALTASCTSVVESGIVKQLRMKDPLIIKGGFNRPNIHYQVVYKELIGGGTQDEVLEHLAAFIKARQGQCGIIYAKLRATCDWLCSALGSCELDVGVYHAGKDGQRRRKVQRDWCEGGLDIVVATVAFGMGIDRADVRWVVHWDVPSSLEGFYQESGRAGRDGKPCESVVYVGADDLDTIVRLEKANRVGSAASVTAFCCQPGCRRKKVLQYFGQSRSACDATQDEQLCDYCREPQAISRLMSQWEEQVQRKSILHALKQQRQQAGGSEDDDEQQQQQEAFRADANQGLHDAVESVDLQLVPKLRPGQWGSAKSYDGAVAAHLNQQPGIKPQLARAHSSSSNAYAAQAMVLKDSNVSPERLPAAELKSAAVASKSSSHPSSVSGVRTSQGPAAVPQLRKRFAKQPVGAFKAPRMMQDSSVSSDSIMASNTLQQQQAPGSNEAHTPIVQQQEQAVLAALGSKVTTTAADSCANEDAAAAHAAGSTNAVMARQLQSNSVQHVGLRRGIAARQAFKPPLMKHS